MYDFVHTYVRNFSIDAEGRTAHCTCACVSALATCGIQRIVCIYLILPSPVCISEFVKSCGSINTLVMAHLLLNVLTYVLK